MCYTVLGQFGPSFGRSSSSSNSWSIATFKPQTKPTSAPRKVTWSTTPASPGQLSSLTKMNNRIIPDHGKVNSSEKMAVYLNTSK
jgi:hypothetical protein